MIADQEEPVAAPGDVAMEAAMAGHIQGDRPPIAIGRHIAHGHAAVFVEPCLDGADRRVNAVQAG